MWLAAGGHVNEILTAGYPMKVLALPDSTVAVGLDLDHAEAIGPQHDFVFLREGPQEAARQLDGRRGPEEGERLQVRVPEDRLFLGGRVHLRRRPLQEEGVTTVVVGMGVAVDDGHQLAPQRLNSLEHAPAGVIMTP